MDVTAIETAIASLMVSFLIHTRARQQSAKHLVFIDSLYAVDTHAFTTDGPL